MPFDHQDIYNTIIEFDGEQHFNSCKRGYITASKHDKMKNRYCIKNNITILRIPFDEEKNIDEILDLFYKKDYNALKEKYIIYLHSPDISINNRKYYSRWCRSKTV